VGTGSTRASSFPVAVLASLGVFGALTYGAFLLLLLGKPIPPTQDHFTRSVLLACRAACFTLLAATCVAGSFIDLGLPFFAFAGFAAGLTYLSCAAAPHRHKRWVEEHQRPDLPWATAQYRMSADKRGASIVRSTQ
jgi:hypothetical protein